MSDAHRFVVVDDCEICGPFDWCRICGQFDDFSNPSIEAHKGAQWEGSSGTISKTTSESNSLRTTRGDGSFLLQGR